LLPEPTVDREVTFGALVARPLTGVDLKRPIGIIQRRGKELGQTAQRFMRLLLNNPANGALTDALEIAGADLDSIELEGAGDLSEDTDVTAEDLSARDEAASLAVTGRPKVS
jgi:hypothetical protein